MLDNIKSWCRHSLTIAWSYLLLAAGAVIELVPPFLELLGAPEVSDAIKSVLPGDAVGLYTVVIAFVTYAARMRSLRSE